MWLTFFEGSPCARHYEQYLTPTILCNPHIYLVFFFFNIYLFLFFGHMWDLSSLTRDQTHAPCSGSTESKQLDHQGSPTSILSLKNFFKFDLFIWLCQVLVAPWGHVNSTFKLWHVGS